MAKRMCCFIPDQSNPETSQCGKEAEYEIWFGNNFAPDNYTDACSEHLEKLFDDSTEFHIFRIGME